MGVYSRGTGYAFPYPFLDPCFYGCRDLSLNSDAAGADTSSWTDAGGPEPGIIGPPIYTSGPYGAPPIPYAGEALGPYATLLTAPYPQAAYDTPGTAQPMVLVPLVPQRRSPDPPDEEETVILVFRDGRQPLQIRNYILTRSAIYLTGKHFNEIPLSDLDLQATQRVNWDAGVTFRLP